MTEDQAPDPTSDAHESTGDGSGDGARPADGAAAGGHYRVLARKYRPATFAGLIGQEAMVQTLTNAIRLGRLAHAFILTGVRGVGKTTTARIIARGLNCIGPGGAGEPTPEPCGECEHCRAISEDRHVDVLEMDAASRTGVDDIRELIEGVRYRPTSARYKVYIIDEVHMLSKPAFNALLKTLEEPPEHVKFIFATTEVRKIPVTVLSRCQRFDLRRVDIDTLVRHFAAVAEQEGAGFTEAALHLIARAADGSVRDGLSLLDQAITDSSGPRIGEDAVRGMLGLADRTVTFDMLDAVMRGDVAAALDLMAEQYHAGADPAVMLTDMLELTHWLTRLKVVADVADAPGVPEAERVRGREMAAKLSMAALTRAWQMLLKGLDEVRMAPAPLLAAEMVVVRLAYAAELPTPAEAVKALGQPAPGAPAPTGHRTTGHRTTGHRTTGHRTTGLRTTSPQSASREHRAGATRTTTSRPQHPWGLRRGGPGCATRGQSRGAPGGGSQPPRPTILRRSRGPDRRTHGANPARQSHQQRASGAFRAGTGRVPARRARAARSRQPAQHLPQRRHRPALGGDRIARSGSADVARTRGGGKGPCQGGGGRASDGQGGPRYLSRCHHRRRTRRRDTASRSAGGWGRRRRRKLRTKQVFDKEGDDR